MKTRISFVSLGAFAVMAMVPNLHAQLPSCPLGLATLTGSWNFSTDGASARYLFVASAGTFTASIGTDKNGNPIGVLSITQTTAADQSITRLETDTGRYTVNSDCTGTLTFDAGSRPVQFDFFLVNATEMVVIGTNNGDIVSGKARLDTALTCPVLPVGAIVGTWIFSVQDFKLPPIGANQALFFNAAGRMVATASGTLIVMDSAGVSSGNVRGELSYGRVDVNPACTGGFMSFAINGRAIQFDYFFTSPDRILLSGALGSEVLIGEARRYGTTD